MILSLFKSCQYCLESIYWRCCEEKFCFDEKIAAFAFDDADEERGYVNAAASLDSIVTQQPNNNNNNNINNNISGGRELSEIPVNADKIYQVFSKSMIFREDPVLKRNLESKVSLDELETKSEPDYLDKPNRTKVYFEDEINSPITDFEIMFKDELLAIEKDMFKIEEEEEEKDDEGGLVMNVVQLKKPGHDLIKPSSITIKEQAKITTTNSVYEYDPSKSVVVSTIAMPKAESVKSILRVNRDLPRSHSDRNLTRPESSTPSKKLTRVESLKNMESKNMNRLLSRVPVRSASYLNLSANAQAEVKPVKKSDSTSAIRSHSNLSLVSHLPDTPIIRSSNLPRFFAETPNIGAYKGETSLQSIKQRNMVVENDFSMPRYYGVTPTAVVDPSPVHESKSMPDLRVNTVNRMVSKRLVKLRGRLKPLVIRKGGERV